MTDDLRMFLIMLGYSQDPVPTGKNRAFWYETWRNDRPGRFIGIPGYDNSFFETGVLKYRRDWYQGAISASESFETEEQLKEYLTNEQ